MKACLANPLVAALLGLSATLASASPLVFHVKVNTASLVANPNGPFSLDFQLNDGSGTLAGPNSATLSNFVFGGGGAASGSESLSGGASGSLASSVVLSDAANFFNEFFQTFTASTTSIGFDVSLTTNPDGATPDEFSMAILDGSLSNIPTTALAGDSLLVVDITSSNLSLKDVRTYASLAPDAGVSVAAVPEPTSLLLAGIGLFAMLRFRQRKERSEPAFDQAIGA